MTPKIATCCYCGTRAALRMDQERHELSCSSCGAPLRNLKRMPVDVFAAVPDGRAPKKRSGSKRKAAHYEDYRPVRKPKKRRKNLMTLVIKEAIDAIEDIFD